MDLNSQAQPPQTTNPKTAAPPIAPPRPLSASTSRNTPDQPKEATINITEKDLQKTGSVKYSIHTMAQDLERVKKEGLSTAIRQPTTPPPAPPTPKLSPLKALPPSPPAQAPKPEEKAEAPKPIMPPSLKKEIPAPPPGLPTAPSFQAPRPPAATPPTTVIPPRRPGVIPPITPKPSRFEFSMPHFKLIVGIISIIILFIGATGFSYWWFFVKTEVVYTPPVIEEEPKEELPEIIEIAEPELPRSIISIDKDIIITTNAEIPSATTTSQILNQISSESSLLQNNAIGRILIKYSSDTEKRFLSFNQTYLMLGIKIPENVENEITNGEFLAYNQNGKIRYGIAAKIKSGIIALDALNAWENTMPEDLQNLFIGFEPTKQDQAVFRDNFYEGFVKSYYNFLEPDTSIDWGVSDDKKVLVIATSKDMIYKIMDSIPVIRQ